MNWPCSGEICRWWSGALLVSSRNSRNGAVPDGDIDHVAVKFVGQKQVWATMRLSSQKVRPRTRVADRTIRKRASCLDPTGIAGRMHRATLAIVPAFWRLQGARPIERLPQELLRPLTEPNSQRPILRRMDTSAQGGNQYQIIPDDFNIMLSGAGVALRRQPPNTVSSGVRSDKLAVIECRSVISRPLTAVNDSSTDILVSVLIACCATRVGTTGALSAD